MMTYIDSLSVVIEFIRVKLQNSQGQCFFPFKRARSPVLSVPQKRLQCHPSGGSRGEARGAGLPIFGVKKEDMTEGQQASRASKSKHPPPPHSPRPLSSRSGSATASHLKGVQVSAPIENRSTC